MEVAIQAPASAPDVNFGSMHQDSLQMQAVDSTPAHAPVQLEIRRNPSEQREPAVTTDQNGVQRAPSKESPQPSTAASPSLDKKTEDRLVPVQAANGPLQNANDDSAVMVDSAIADTLGMQSSDGHFITQNALTNTNLAMQLPQRDGIAPGVLHSDLDAGMVPEQMPLSLSEISDPSQVDASTLQSMDEMDLTAYAKLEFPDTTYLVRTLSVELGRDNSAKQQAKRMAVQFGSESESQSRPSSAGDATRTAMRQESKAPGGCHAFSEEGGIIMWNASSSDSNQRTRSQNSKKPKSSRNKPKPVLSESQYEAAFNVAKRGDLRHAFPPYDACPLLPIHIPDGFDPEMYKSISRKHAKIEYNPDKELFELHALSRNGIFINTVFHPAASSIPLRHDDIIQVGPVAITFRLPSNVVEKQQNEFDGTSDESEDDVDGIHGQSSQEGNGGVDDSSEELVQTIESDEGSSQASASEEERVPPKQQTKLKIKALPSRQKPKDSSATKRRDSKSAVTQKDTKRAKNKQSEKSTGARHEKKKETSTSAAAAAETSAVQQNSLEGALPIEIPPKRKGPGRPPKDGIMSKRERQARAKQAKEAEKARKLGLPPPPPLDLKTKTEKKRQKREEEEASGSARPATADAEKAVASSSTPTAAMSNDQIPPTEQQKPAKAPKPPPAKSPSPEMKESDFTEEQLARPSSNYITLIHEAITNSKNGQMNLQQIYSAIERKYPYYKFKTTTTGWQSSVRHNLGQNSMFQKVEKEGKGYLWAVKEGATPENQKRKRSSPPPMSQHPYYPPNQYPGLNGGPGQPRPGGPAYPQYPPQRPPFAAPPAATPPMVAPPAQSSSNYSSPYAANPPGPAARAPQAPSNLSNGIAYSQPQHPGADVRTPSRSAPGIVPQPSAQQKGQAPPPSNNPNPSLTSLIGDDFPKDLPISLPGGAKVLTPEMKTRLQRFKDVFVDVSMGDRRHSDLLVSQAIKRIFYPGLIQKPFLPGEEDIMKTLIGLLQEQMVTASVQGHNQSQSQSQSQSQTGAAVTAPAPAPAPSDVSPAAHAQHAAVVANSANPPVSPPPLHTTGPENTAPQPDAEPVDTTTTTTTPAAAPTAANADATTQANPQRVPPAAPPPESSCESSASTHAPATGVPNGPPSSRSQTPPAPAVEPLTPAAGSPTTTNGERDRDAHKRDRETDAESEKPSEKKVRTENSEGD